MPLFLASRIATIQDFRNDAVKDILAQLDAEIAIPDSDPDLRRYRNSLAAVTASGGQLGPGAFLLLNYNAPDCVA